MQAFPNISYNKMLFQIEMRVSWKNPMHQMYDQAWKSLARS